MPNSKIVIRLLQIMNHVTSCAFIVLMLFLWHALDDAREFLLVSIPSMIIFGSMQGNSALLVSILKNHYRSASACDDGKDVSA